MVALWLLCAWERGIPLSSPVCALVVGVSCPTVQLHGVLLLHLRLVLHSLDAVSVLACVLYALVDVAHIDCFQLEPLCLAIGPTPGSRLVAGDVILVGAWRLAGLRRNGCVVIRGPRSCLLLLFAEHLVGILSNLTLTRKIRQSYGLLVGMVCQAAAFSLMSVLLSTA